MMLNDLKALEKRGDRIRVGLVGTGAMGLGIAHQVRMAPGMEIAWVSDLDPDAVAKAKQVAGCERSGEVIELLDEDPVDVLVEATNSIGAAAEFSLAAIAAGSHLVLMNAEVDLALGPYLQQRAKRAGVIVTSDAGDQHGVLKPLMDEVEMWGFEVVQAGNIKGFLDRYATPESIHEEAAKRNLSDVQCCAYTDGTKLNIEMAVLANATGLLPKVRGMEGPRCDDVHEALELFEFDDYPKEGVVDYILGAEPGPGVYVIGRSENAFQQPYLSYYKLGEGPYYVFYRPYHLCHLETPSAIAKACLYKQAWLAPRDEMTTDVYAFAKRDLKAGEEFEHGIGDALCYGLIDTVEVGTKEDLLPVVSLEQAPEGRARMLADCTKDQPILASEVSLPDSHLNQLRAQQSARSVAMHARS